MLDLALNEAHGPIRLSGIADRQDISLAYLEQLFARLRKRGLVESVRGPGGGYRLQRSGDDITVADVIDAVDESVDATKCHGQKNCQGQHLCLTHDLWHELSAGIRSFLDGISLAELVRRQQERVIEMPQSKTG